MGLSDKGKQCFGELGKLQEQAGGFKTTESAFSYAALFAADIGIPAVGKKSVAYEVHKIAFLPDRQNGVKADAKPDAAPTNLALAEIVIDRLRREGCFTEMVTHVELWECPPKMSQVVHASILAAVRKLSGWFENGQVKSGWDARTNSRWFVFQHSAGRLERKGANTRVSYRISPNKPE